MMEGQNVLHPDVWLATYLNEIPMNCCVSVPNKSIMRLL